VPCSNDLVAVMYSTYMSICAHVCVVYIHTYIHTSYIYTHTHTCMMNGW
jgi:hypothetical protein